MFTGIVRTVGRIDERVEHAPGDVSFAVATAAIDPAGIAVGDSICISGACLTAVEVTPAGFRTDISAESLARTTLRGFAAGRRVNLETALKPDTPLGGHLVSGHVDGVAEVLARRGDARSVRFEIRAPDALARYVAEKGSVCIDGGEPHRQRSRRRGLRREHRPPHPRSDDPGGAWSGIQGQP